MEFNEFFEQVFIGNEGFEKFISSLYRKYGKTLSLSRKDFGNHVYSLAYEALFSFELKSGDFNSNLGRMILVAKSNVMREVHQEANKSVRVQEDGKSFILKLALESTDSDLYKDLPAEKGEVLENQFIEWFKENKHNILMPSQLRFLDALESAGSDYSSETFFQETGVQTKNRSAHIQRIVARVEKAYKPVKKTTEEKELEKILNLLNSSSTIKTQNEAFEHWLRIKSGTDFLINILVDGLKQETYLEYVKLVHGEEFKTTLLYECYELLEARLDFLKSYEPVSVVDKKKQHRKAPAASNSEVRVYCMKTGELKRVEQGVAQKEEEVDVRVVNGWGIPVKEVDKL